MVFHKAFVMVTVMPAGLGTLLHGQGTASLNGIAVTPDGKPVAGLAIVASVLGGAETKLSRPLFGVVAVSGLQTASGTTGKDGAFLISGLEAATYVLCMKPAAGYLDPCEWGPQAARVEVAAGKAVTGVKVRVRAASTLKIRLNDSGGLLSQAAHAGHISVGVTTPGGTFHPSAQTGNDGAGFDFQVEVPLDVASGFEGAEQPCDGRRCCGNAGQRHGFG